MDKNGQTVEYELSEGVLTLTLNRPETLNAFDDAMLTELLAALRKGAEDDAVRVVVLTGKGRGFCAGQDLKAYLAKGPVDAKEHLITFYIPLIQTLAEFPKPTIAQINGVAAGAGMSLALAADLKVATRDAKFIQAFSRIGLVPDSGSTHFLTRTLGPARALELMLLGESIDADTACRWGLVNRVVDPPELTDAVGAWARKLAAGPPVAFALTKALVRRAASATLAESLADEAESQGRAARTEDHQDALLAFAQKTVPVFKGR